MVHLLATEQYVACNMAPAALRSRTAALAVVVPVPCDGVCNNPKVVTSGCTARNNIDDDTYS
jgi:hypothetical protein